jgi:hypothetical protein
VIARLPSITLAFSVILAAALLAQATPSAQGQSQGTLTIGAAPSIALHGAIACVRDGNLVLNDLSTATTRQRTDSGDAKPTPTVLDIGLGTLPAGNLLSDALLGGTSILIPLDYVAHATMELRREHMGWIWQQEKGLHSSRFPVSSTPVSALISHRTAR